MLMVVACVSTKNLSFSFFLTFYIYSASFFRLVSIWGYVEERDGKVSDMDKPNWLEWDSEQDRMHGNLELINQMSISEFCLHIMSLFWRRWGLTSSTCVYVPTLCIL